MKIREEGPYWVKRIGIWGIAYWCPNDRLWRASDDVAWFLFGASSPKSDDYFDEIDEEMLRR